MRKLKTITINILLVLLSFVGKATTSFVLDESVNKVNKGISVLHYHDKTFDYSIKDVISLRDNKFELLDNQSINLGYRNKSNWLRIDLDYQSDNKKFYFVNELYFIQKSQCFLVKDGVIIDSSSVQGVRMKSSDLIGRFYFFPLKFQEKGNYQVYINIQNPYSSLRPVLKIYSENAYQEYIKMRPKEINLYLFISGVLSLILLATIVTFFIRREKLYLLYFLFTLCNFHSLLTNSGLLVEVHRYFAGILAFEPRTYNGFWLMLTSVPYAYEFHKEYLPKWTRNLTYSIVVYVLLSFAVSFFVTFDSLIFVANSYIMPVFFILSVLCFIIFPIKALLNGYKLSILFIIAYSGFILNTFYTLAYIFKLIPFVDFIYTLEACVTFELVVMAFALGQRIVMISKDNYLLKKELTIEQQRFIDKSIEVQNKERSTIAHDLHEDIGQQLAGLKLMWYHQQNNPSQEESQKFTEVLEGTIENVRELSHRMMPSHLLKAGLGKALESLCDSYRSKGIVNFESSNLDEIHDEQLVLHFYRISQELINYALHKRNAHLIDVFCACTTSKIVLTIVDDGDYIEVESIHSSEDLRQVYNRAVLLDSKLMIDSVSGENTTFILRVNYVKG